MTKSRKSITALPVYKTEVDQITLDFIAVDSSTGIPVGKPILSTLHDSISKEILGLNVSIKALVIDNGQELENSGIENMCSEFGIYLIRHPHFKPQFKGVVERHFEKQNRALILDSLKPIKSDTDQIPSKISKRVK